MRNCLKCSVKLNLKSVTCPGTIHIQNRNPVYLSVCLFGKLVKTKAVLATYPLRFNERFKFEKIFTVAQTLDSVQEILQDDDVVIELCQYSDLDEGGNTLASFVQSSKEFLYPKPSFVAKDDYKREALLSRLPSFSYSGGLDPKLAFSTQTEIIETNLVEHYDDKSQKQKHIPTASAKILTRTKGTPSSKGDTTLFSTGNTRPRSGYHSICINTDNTSSQRKHNRSKSANTLTGRPPFKVGKAPVKEFSAGNSTPKQTPKSSGNNVGKNIDNYTNSHGTHTISKTPPVVLVYSSSSEEEDANFQPSKRKATPSKPTDSRFEDIPRRSVISPIRRDLSTPKDVKERVKRLLAKNKSFLEYDSSDDEDEDFDADFAVNNKTSLQQRRDWPTTFANLPGESRRTALHNRYKDIYQKMYEKAVDSDGTL